jgi:hypothetical protein
VFLNVLMLMGLGAAAVPLVLHLLSRARYRTVDWGAMMFLRGAEARHRQSTRLNQLLLVLVRMAVVGLLAVAIARPVVRGAWVGHAQGGGLTAAIVLDCSASMAFEENGRSRFELARGAAQQVLAGLKRGDRAFLVLAGLDNATDPRDLRPTPELRSVDARLATLRPGHGSADLAAAVKLAWQRLEAYEPLQRQIFVITDRQSLSWRGVTGSETWASPWLNQPRDAAVPTEGFIIPIGSTASDNIVVESVALVDPPAVRGQPVEVEVRVRNFGPVRRAALPLVVRFDETKVYEAKVNIGPDSSATFRASVKEGFPSAGSHVIFAAVSSSGYPADDRLSTAVEVIEPVRVLVVSGDERTPGDQGTLRGESDFVRVALAPYQASTGQPGRDPCTVEVQPIEDWDGTVLGAFDVLIIANVERFDARQVRELEQFVYGGGGVLIAPGNLSRVDNYNEMLYRGGAGLMPAELLPATPGDGSQATALLGWRPDHPVFRFLRGRPDPLPSSTIGRYFPSRPHQPDATSLAEYVSGWPLLVETPRQARERRGRVILITTPLDVDWGNLPFSNFYLPFTQSLMRYLCGGGVAEAAERNLTPGEPVVATLGASPLNRTVTLLRPGAQQPTPLELTRFGDQAEVRYADTREPGEYRMAITEEGRPPYTVHYVVTASRDESDLTQLTDDAWATLRQRLGFRRLDTADEPIAAAMSASRDGRQMWSILLCAVLVLAVLELAMARAYSRAPGGRGADERDDALQMPGARGSLPAR